MTEYPVERFKRGISEVNCYSFNVRRAWSGRVRDSGATGPEFDTNVLEQNTISSL